MGEEGAPEHPARAGISGMGAVTAGAVFLALLISGIPAPASSPAVSIELGSVMQGSYAVVTVAGTEGPGKIEALDRKFPLFADADGLRAIIPVHLSTRPGRYELVVRLPGRTIRREMKVERRPGEKLQKLSALTVDDKRAMAMKDDRVEMRTALRKTGQAAMWAGPLRHPIPGRISAVFGQKRVYGGGASWFHSGVDFAMPKGWPVVASAPGRVEIAGMMPSYGNTVVIDHGQTVHTVYMHLSKVLVSDGERVNEGQLIGLVGDTGFALGPHLHFSSYIGTVPVDPLEFLERGLP